MNNILNLFANGIVNYLLFGSVVAALLTLLAWGFIRVAKVRAPIYRHMIWLYLLMGILVLPAIWLGGPKLTLAVLPAKVEPLKTEVLEMDVGSAVKLEQNTPDEIHSPSLKRREMPVETNPAARAFPIRAVLAGMWLVGVVFVLARLAVGWYRLRRIRLSTAPVSQNERIADLEGQKLRILVTSRVRGPVCFGLLRPVILLPKEMYEKSTEEDLQMVLNHELAHIERRDCLTNLFQRIIEAVFFFHPLVLYASFQLTQQREQICDNYVLKKGVPVIDYVKLLSRIAEQGLEKPWFRAVALFEGRLAQRVRSLLDPKHSSQIKASRRARIVCAIAVLICSAFCTLRLDAKSASIDPKIRELGEAVRKRLTTYSDEKTLTLKDGRTGRMKVKDNVTEVAGILITPHIVEDGTKFDLEGLDAAGKAIEGTKTTSPIIHDAQTMRMNLNKRFSVDGEDILSKIQLSPARQDDNSVVVEVKVLFTRMATPEEINAMLLTGGKDGRLRLDYREISSWLEQYKQRAGNYPKNLEELDQLLPKDVYSPAGEDYRYEAQRSRFILSSCGEDGIYGNEDDQILIANQGRMRSGQRHEIYQLKEDEEVEAQTETVGPSGRRPKGNCSIGGKVISAKTGEPISHAKVYLFCLATHDAIFIDVSSDGSFEFKDIPAGTYSLRTINTAGFQDAIYNPENRYGQYPKFSLKDKEKRTDLLLKAKPAYSISGRVLDENGEPLRDRTIWVLAWVELDEPEGNLNRYNIVEQTRITSDGAYLLGSLDERPVYVMAIDWKSPEKDEFYPPCYYPGTVARNEAKKVRFDEGKSVDGIDIHLKKKGKFILEGVVKDEETSKAVPKALVTVHHRDMLFDRVTTYTDEQGRYRIDSLGTGIFLVHVDAKPSGFVRARKPVTIDAATKTSRLDFTLKPGVMISGKFVNENRDDIQIGPNAYGLAYRYGYTNPETMSWSGARNKYGTKGRAGSSTFNGGQGDYEEEYMDFPTPSTFIIEGIIPGRTVFRFHPKTEGQIVKDILYNGRSIMETGLETKPGQEIKDVTIIIGTP